MSTQLAIEGITFKVKRLEAFWLIDSFFDHVVRHESPRFFCVETNELISTRRFFFEHRLDDRCAKGTLIDGFEILIGGEVDDRSLFVR